MSATKYNFSEILSVMDKKNYAYYTRGLYNLNLIGVRSENSVSDKFDDLLYAFYRADDNHFKLHEFPMTSDAGRHWLLNPMNIRGCAILVPGQYRNCYQIGGMCWFKPEVIEIAIREKTMLIQIRIFKFREIIKIQFHHAPD